MNILHIAPYYPSVNAMHAGGVAMGHEIGTLKKLGHNVFIVAFTQKEYDYQLYMREHNNYDDYVLIGKEKKIMNIIRHPFSPLLFSTRMDSLFFKKIKQSIKKNNIQAIHLEYSSMLWCLKLKKSMPYLKFVSVLHDVTIQSYERKVQIEKKNYKKFLLSLETKRVFRYEKKYLRMCDEIVTFSEKDKNLISKYYNLSARRINTYFGLDEIIEKKNRYERIQDGYFSVCFVGQMGRKENEEAAVRLISLFEKIKNEKKRLFIVGAKPSDYLKSYSKSNVVITGFVEDIDVFVLNNCDIACFPLISGAGIKIKVLEAIALGIPVITNSIGAEGIDEDYNYLIPAESDEDFIRQIEAVVFEKHSNFQEFFKDFDWSITEKVFKEIYGVNTR